ncbi:Ankyrin repeat [Promicromonospora umidemergens]|uniref:Ankyrin repeat protein n=1 Tax=Promicromonospora umidemergens TaxID=629679 RepID=A0ABP8XTU6_9MICO|nr:ankyrin repeat domain-containing protein [Promicromonospora umidemergens]MCP2285154.1 Ankyrin repeat [Promicromonospora umidemergens]
MESGATVIVVILTLLVAAALIAGFRAKRKEAERQQANSSRRRTVGEASTKLSSQRQGGAEDADQRSAAEAPINDVAANSVRQRQLVPQRAAGKTDLMHLAAIGDEVKVRGLLDRGADIHAVDDDGDCVLRYVSGSQNAGLFELLLSRGADANARSTSASGMPGFTILHALAEAGWSGGIATLGQYGVTVDSGGVGGVTAMMLAAGAGQNGALMALRELGANVNAVDNDGDPVLYYAASRGHGKTTRLLISLGADANRPQHGTSPTPLMAAATLAVPGTRRPQGTSATDFEKVIVELLRGGADPKPMYDAGYALLRRVNGRIELPPVERVRQAVNVHDGWGVVYLTPYGRATVWSGVGDSHDPEAVRTRLMVEYASLDAARVEQQAFVSRSLVSELGAREGSYGLHYVETAAEVQLLLRQGAPINGSALIEYGDPIQHWETPLLTALVDERRVVARELIRSGADVDAPNAAIFLGGGGFGHSALHMMIERRDHDGVQLLISAGADVNRQTTLGSTPLYFAASVDDPDLVRVLLNAGARPQIRDLEGKFPAETAGPRTRHLLG